MSSQSTHLYPDFSSQGYQTESVLGENRGGGRVTYKAVQTTTYTTVVIKQFQFAAQSASWNEYDAYQSELKMLQALNHPSIPRYIDSFETDNGFCLVQEYKKAVSLAQRRHFELQEIQQIAIAVLNILVYLQQQHPPVIHRDLKPENILVDRTNGLNVYLVDFGFARTASQELAVSSVVKGTLGFMPPEQLLNRQLTEASDLYGLGATLICLLTRTPSTQINTLIDEQAQIKFRHLLPQVKPQLVQWLERMVAPSLKKRYATAAEALKALQSIDVTSKSTFIDTITSRMNLKAAGLGGALFIGVSFSAVALLLNQPNPAIQQLVKTRACEGCNLQHANLTGLDLSGVRLRGANLSYANLERTHLEGSSLEDAVLKGAKLRAARLRGANLRNANVRSANLNAASLMGANMNQADFEGSELDSTDLSHSILENANFSYANLRNANFKGAQIRGAKFKYPKTLSGVTWQDGRVLRCQNPEVASTCQWH